MIRYHRTISLEDSVEAGNGLTISGRQWLHLVQAVVVGDLMLNSAILRITTVSTFSAEGTSPTVGMEQEIRCRDLDK